MAIRIDVVTSNQFAEILPALARLRIKVFREFPYLYDGDLEYEKRYLDVFSQSKNAIIVIARDGIDIVGASTGAPLQEIGIEWQQPFIDRKVNISDIFYCAESVLLSEYRGQGIGHIFFAKREDHARQCGAKISCFCSVLRPPSFEEPKGYRSHNAFWEKRGYQPESDLTTRFSWTDIGDQNETEKTLQYWVRKL